MESKGYEVVSQGLMVIAKGHHHEVTFYASGRMLLTGSERKERAAEMAGVHLRSRGRFAGALGEKGLRVGPRPFQFSGVHPHLGPGSVAIIDDQFQPVVLKA